MLAWLSRTAASSPAPIAVNPWSAIRPARTVSRSAARAGPLPLASFAPRSDSCRVMRAPVRQTAPDGPAPVAVKPWSSQAAPLTMRTSPLNAGPASAISRAPCRTRSSPTVAPVKQTAPPGLVPRASSVSMKALPFTTRPVASTAGPAGLSTRVPVSRRSAVTRVPASRSAPSACCPVTSEFLIVRAPTVARSAQTAGSTHSSSTSQRRVASRSVSGWSSRASGQPQAGGAADSVQVEVTADPGAVNAHSCLIRRKVITRTPGALS